MKKNILIALGIMAIIAAGYWWQSSRVVPAPQDTVPQALSFNSVKKTSETDKAMIAMEYPYFKDATTDNQRRINALIDEIVIAVEEDFKKSTPDSTPPGDDKSSLSVKSQIIRNDERVVSIRLDVGWYNSGAAHPNAFTAVVNYDLANGRQIKLADLFPGSPDYLARLADKAAAALKEKFAKDEIPFEDYAQEGTAPKAENYQNFLINEDALVIIFDPYQVGPWAIGIQEIVIPFKDLGISI
jgi:hypothetical protein